MLAILEKSFASHGGFGRWQGVSHLDAALDARGWLLKIKFKGSALKKKTLSTSTSLNFPEIIIKPYPAAGHTGIFDIDGVRVERDNGEALMRREDPLEGFDDLRHAFYWDPLDVLYVFGYTLAACINMPFLPGYDDISCTELEKPEKGTEGLHGVGVTLPTYLHAHSQRQEFYYDGSGLLVRADSGLDLFGDWARIITTFGSFTDVDGFRLATRITIYAKKENGLPLKAMPLADIRLSDISLRYKK